jgi:hypothetical protein
MDKKLSVLEEKMVQLNKGQNSHICPKIHAVYSAKSIWLMFYKNSKAHFYLLPIPYHTIPYYTIPCLILHHTM